MEKWDTGVKRVYCTSLTCTCYSCFQWLVDKQDYLRDEDSYVLYTRGEKYREKDKERWEKTLSKVENYKK